MRYSVKTLVLLILVPLVVLALFATLAVLVCRRLHPRRLERLHEFDTEQGAIDGLITSNVGDSTLAVRTHPLSYLLTCFQRCHLKCLTPVLLLYSLYSAVLIHRIHFPPRFCRIGPSRSFLHVGQRLRSAVPGAEDGSASDQPGGMCW